MGMPVGLFSRVGLNGAILLILMSCKSGDAVGDGACETLILRSKTPVPDLIERKYKDSDPKATQWWNERPCVESYTSGFPGGADGIMSGDPDEVKKDLLSTLSLFDVPRAQLKKQISEASEAEDPSGIDTQWQRKYHILEGWDRQLVDLFGSSLYLKRLSDESDFDAFDVEIARLKSRLGFKALPLTEWNNLEANTYFSRQALINIIRAYELKVAATRAATESLDAEEMYRRASELSALYLVDRVAISHVSSIIDGPEAALIELCSAGASSE